MNHYSTFLFASPSLFEGVGRALDFGGTLTEFNRSIDGRTADAIALMTDWAAIGYDLADAITVESGAIHGREQGKTSQETR